MPNEPLLTLVGPLNVVQLVETTLLNLTNYPTLIASLTHRLRLNFGDNVKFIEEDSCFAQSPYGGVLGIKYASSASLNCIIYSIMIIHKYLGTTNLLAAKSYNIPLFIKNDINNPEDEYSDFNNNDCSSKVIYINN